MPDFPARRTAPLTRAERRALIDDAKMIHPMTRPTAPEINAAWRAVRALEAHELHERRKIEDRAAARADTRARAALIVIGLAGAFGVSAITEPGEIRNMAIGAGFLIWVMASETLARAITRRL